MVTAVEETADFAAISDALLINIGTLDSFQLAAMTAAISGAVAAGKPWVLDPITAGLPFRMTAICPMLEQRPTVIRGNASEIISLATLSTRDFKGIDAKSSTEEALEPARYLAKTYKTVVAISGETDYVTDGDKTFQVTGGHPYMTRVTGIGCALNAVIAAYIATCKDAVIGTRAALSVFSLCGQHAALEAKGTGSFAVAFLDQLSSINIISEDNAL